MADYRLYFLDDAGSIRHAVEMECTDDQAAILALEGHRDGRAMELWQRARKVAEFAKSA